MTYNVFSGTLNTTQSVLDFVKFLDLVDSNFRRTDVANVFTFWQLKFCHKSCVVNPRLAVVVNDGSAPGVDATTSTWGDAIMHSRCKGK